MEEKPKPAINPNVITDDLEIYNYLNKINSRRERLWVWQTAERKEDRRVQYAFIKTVDAIKKSLYLIPNSRSGFKLSRHADVFVYSEAENIALKTSIKGFSKDYLSLDVPRRLNRLSENILEKLNLVEKDNAQENMHLRKAPRQAFPEGQMISLLRSNSSEEEPYELFDLSTGGMGFKVLDPGDFAVGDELTATALNGEPLKTPYVGKVVAVRALDDDPDTFKVGVKFEN